VTCGRELKQHAHNGEDVQGWVVRRRVNKKGASLAVEETVFEEEVELDGGGGLGEENGEGRARITAASASA